MAHQNFTKALDLVLKHEGGFVNHPKDPGGATNKGVTQAVYDGYRLRVKQPKRSVKDISSLEVREIYRLQYWDAIRGDELPAGLDYVVFDGAVNSGVKQSVKWLQRCLPNYSGPIDGQLGEGTIGAITGMTTMVLIDRICDRRMAFLRALKTWSTFGKGWTNRVADVRVIGKRMVTKPDTDFEKQAVSVGGDPKAVLADANLPHRATSTATTATGIGISTVGGVLQQAQDAIQPLAAAVPSLSYVVTVLVVVGAVTAISGLAMRYWQSRRRAEAVDALDLEA